MVRVIGRAGLALGGLELGVRRARIKCERRIELLVFGAVRGHAAGGLRG